MKKFFVFSIFCFLFIYVHIFALDLITNIDGRNTISLNGHWEYIVDPYETGYYDYRYQPNLKEGYFNIRVPENKSDRIEYAYSDHHQLQVPGDWNTQKENLFYYEGTIWYKKDFTYEKKSGKRLFIYFGAVNYQAIVFVNGKKVGEHEGGFTPFNFEITDVVQNGDNYVVVKADNKRFREAVPTVNTDWWNYGGLTRRVVLIETESTFVKDYMIQLRPGTKNKFCGWVQLDGPDLNQNVVVEIPELKLKKSFQADPEGKAEIEFTKNVIRWSPENPKLYKVKITAGDNTVTDKIGFRSIETRGTDILLNGQSIFLRGICLHEEAPLRTGRCYSKEDAYTLLSWAKELGCNFVRLAHYPHNENTIRVADELGILVWSEVPVYWTILFDNDEVYKKAENQLTEMITRDKNKASVILWSVANETPVSETRTEFLSRLAKKAKALDPTRLTTAAQERIYLDDTTLYIEDPLGEYLDVLGCNEYVGWYDGLPEKCNRVNWKVKYEKPLIMSEFGGGALYNHRGDSLTRWTEDYQAYLYQQQVNMLKTIEPLRGTTPWILMDFRSPKRPLYGIQDGWNRKGLVSERGHKKQAFYVMQKWYEEMRDKE